MKGIRTEGWGQTSLREGGEGLVERKTKERWSSVIAFSFQRQAQRFHNPPSP